MCNWMIFILYLTSTLEVVGNLVGCFHYVLRVFLFLFCFLFVFGGFFLGGGNFFLSPFSNYILYTCIFNLFNITCIYIIVKGISNY